MGNLKKLFGRNMKFIRKARGFTQEKLGELIDINQRQLTRIECGKNFPSSDTLEKICHCLNVPIKQMFDFQLECEELAMTGTDNRATYRAVKFGSLIKLEQVDSDEKLKKVQKYNNKKINANSSDLEMLAVAKKSNTPITVEYSEDGEIYKIAIYFPDGTFKYIKDNANSTDEEGLNKILGLLKEISDNPHKMKFVELAIKALEDKKSCERLRATLDGMELIS